MAKCECGCGQDAKGDFLPGHDQKLRVALEKRVGGLLAIRSLVEASDDYVLGRDTEQGLAQRIRMILFRRAEK